MKNKGFTLIELLAVIVVLAIIALIATPIVMNLIKDAKLGAAERSAERYVDAVEMSIAQYRLNNNEQLSDGEYIVDADGNLVSGTTTLTVEVSGDKPDAGSKVVIQNGQVVHTGTTLNYDDAYTVTINEDGKATAVEKAEAEVLTDMNGNTYTYTDEKYFNITNDGKLTLKSEYATITTEDKYPYNMYVEYHGDYGNLTELNIPETINGIRVTSISGGAGPSSPYLVGPNVRVIRIPEGVTSVQELAFGTMAASYPGTSTSIGMQITSLYIPSTLTSVPTSAPTAFQCTSNTTVYINMKQSEAHSWMTQNKAWNNGYGGNTAPTVQYLPE